jgi:hypothetical protein
MTPGVASSSASLCNPVVGPRAQPTVCAPGKPVAGRCRPGDRDGRPPAPTPKTKPLSSVLFSARPRSTRRSPPEHSGGHVSTPTAPRRATCRRAAWLAVCLAIRARRVRPGAGAAFSHESEAPVPSRHTCPSSTNRKDCPCAPHWPRGFARDARL